MQVEVQGSSAFSGMHLGTLRRAQRRRTAPASRHAVCPVQRSITGSSFADGARKCALGAYRSNLQLPDRARTDADVANVLHQLQAFQGVELSCAAVHTNEGLQLKQVQDECAEEGKSQHVATVPLRFCISAAHPLCWPRCRCDILHDRPSCYHQALNWKQALSCNLAAIQWTARLHSLAGLRYACRMTA